jgi:Tol biopolymer transport system component
MSVARLEIDEALRAPATPAETPREPPGIRVRGVIAIATAALLLGALAATWALFARPAAETSSPLVAQIGPPPDVISAFQEGFALSPDGTTLAFAARDASGVRQIWIRRLDTAAAQPLRGTEGGNYPFWSPDSAHVGFFADGQLRRVAAAGGQVQTVCATRGQFPTGSWNEADDILFGVMRERHLRIYRVPAAGGDPTQIALDGEAIRPEWLPGGRRFLYAGGTETDWGLRIGSVDGGPSELVTGMVRWNYAYSRAGYVFLNQNDALTAQRFDADAGRLTGSPVTLTGRAGTPKTWFAVSSSGTQLVALARQSPSEPGDPGDPWARLRWINRRGEFVGELGDSGRYWTLRLAPDGQRASVNPGSEIWVLDPNQRHLRLTSDGIESMHAVWSVDGSEVIYEHGENEIVRQAVSHGARHSVLPNALGLVGDWSRDGRWLILERTSATDPSRDLSLYDLETQSVQPWLATEFDEVQARFSPDGRWIAYASNATGRFEVYVRAREGAGRQTTISTRGGVHPIWRGDGRELFYLSPDDEMMAAAILAEGATLGVGETTRLFRVPINDITKGFYSPYDVAPDGQRFLLNVPDRPSSLFFLRGLDGLVR